MGTPVMQFANQLFSFTAIKYAMDPKRKPDEPSAEECVWTSPQFSIDIGRAVLMLSYTYRSAFKRHFQKVSRTLCSSIEAAKLYPILFARATYRCHCPFKILVLCSFISEMYLHIYFKTGAPDHLRRYIIPCMLSFNEIYKSVLKVIDDPIPKWNDVKCAATLIAKGHSILEPIMNTEHPSQDKLFFDSVTELLAAKGNATETKDSSEIIGNEATNKPSKTAITQQPTSQTSTKASASKGNPSPYHQYQVNLVTTNKPSKTAITQQQTSTKASASKGNPSPNHQYQVNLVATNKPSETAITQQPTSQTSTKASTSKGNQIPKNRFSILAKKGKRKLLARMNSELKAKAAIRRNASISEETASTSTANLSLERLQISGASVDASSVEEKIFTEDSSISFGTVDEIASEIPGFDICDKLEGKMDKPEAHSVSSVAKATSKKQTIKN